MTDRFDPLPLVKRAFSEMRRRSQLGAEPPDRVARLVLLGVPLAAGVASWVLAWSVRSADSLVAGFSLLAAALLAGVPQLAGWRQRLTDRDRTSEGIARRKLDEAVANTLLGVLLSIALAVLAIVIANIVVPSAPNANDAALPGSLRILTAILVAGGTYLVLTVLLIVNLLFDAYSDANPDTALKDEDERWADTDDPGRGAA